MVARSVTPDSALPASDPHAPASDPLVRCCVCDYDLRSIAPQAHCPECGSPAAESYRQIRGLSSHHALAILLRLLALYFAVQTATGTANLILSTVGMFLPSGQQVFQWTNAFVLFHLLTQFSLLAFQGVVAAVFWWKALPLAQKITRTLLPTSVPLLTGTMRLSAERLFFVLTGVLGLFLVVTHLFNIAHLVWVLKIYPEHLWQSQRTDSLGYLALSGVIPFCAGLVLLGSHRLRVFLSRQLVGRRR